MFLIDVYVGGQFAYTYPATTRYYAIRFVQMYNAGNNHSKAVHRW
jgi:hypothetical protein